MISTNLDRAVQCSRKCYIKQNIEPTFPIIIIFMYDDIKYCANICGTLGNKNKIIGMVLIYTKVIFEIFFKYEWL